MTTMTETPHRITGGVDTHRDVHVVAALDERGTELAAAPELVARHGVGTETAGALLVASEDNPERLPRRAGLRTLLRRVPDRRLVGHVARKRLNRGGNRHANQALWRIVMVRLVSDPATRHYVERRTKEGLSKLEAIRCLKRYVARELYPFLAADAL